VILLAHAEGAEWYALVQALLSECRAEEVQRALVGVLGEYERDEVKCIGSSKFSPSIFWSVTVCLQCAFAFRLTPDDYTSPALL
jgi:hypothetical protein